MTGAEAVDADWDALLAPDPEPDPYEALAGMRAWTFLPSEETR